MFTATVVVVTLKLALVASAGIVNDPGTEAFALLDLKLTAIPPEGAAELRVTVHEEAAGGSTDAGLHEIPLKLGPCGMVIVPPAVEVEMAVLSGAAAAPLRSWIEEDVFDVNADIVRLTVATTPFAMVVEFKPHTTHVEAPIPLLHESDLLAAVVTGPAATLTEETSVLEYASVHWIAAG